MNCVRLIAIFLVVLLGACARNQIVNDYVVSSGQAKQNMPHGKSAAPLTANGVDTVWVLERTGIAVNLKNLNPTPIRILWDDSVIVDPQGTAHSIIHSGVRFMARDQPQPPSLVPSGSQIQSVVAPKDNVEWSGSDWHLSRLFRTDLAKGDKFRVALTLDVDGQKVYSEFIFELSGVRCEIHEAPLNKYFHPNQPCT